MFGDLVGSIALSARLDPEECTRLGFANSLRADQTSAMWTTRTALEDASIRGGVNRPAPRSYERRLRTHSPFAAKIVRQTDAQDPVWPLSFWKEVCRQYQRKWRAPDCMVYPAAGYVNSRIVERKDPQTP